MSETESLIVENTFSIFSEDVKRYHRWFMVLGLIMIALGTAAILFPFVATMAVEILIGWIFVISGAFGIVHAFGVRKWKGFSFSLLGAVLSLAIGIILLFYPMAGMLSLTLLLAAFFLVSGIFRVILAFSLRPADHWGWLMVSGVLAFVLAILVMMQWPTSATWFIGVLVGIDLIFSGWMFLTMSIMVRRSI
ncbi:MAG: HdeD family acid-resistance protein [Gammaproteobacteria bacterium]|jgi:uncharacterized membrane protein HdeD (DUF308 family)|nr:HdeD family acid-resistance protein [Gammaproteobacteria bacterium]